MAIRVVVPPEPLSPASIDLQREMLVVSSRAALLLREELRRYCEGETRGRSFLVAGHRGSGKTTMVEHAFLDLWKDYARSGATVRPLRVLIPGPSLLGADFARRPGPDEAGAGASPREAQSVVADALIQVTLALHRAAAAAFAEAYRSRALERAATDPRRYADLPEMAAQLEVELFEGIQPARLRDFWARGGFVSSGVLFPSVASEPRAGQGARELLALAGVCEAYRRISGQLTQTENRKDAAAGSVSASVGTAESGAQLLKGLAALLTGGLVGGGILQTTAGVVPALLGGLTAALGAAAVFRYSISRSRTRTADREVEFVMDLSVQTLDRVLPIIVDRLRAAGLAPLFVVDELDKVDDLSTQIENLVTHLKKFVSESAFFCFLTDRSYFEGYQARGRNEPYSKEYTYFSHQLFVAHTADDLHGYLQSVFQPETPEDQADAEILEYVVLHRAEMHTVDVQRVLARWQSSGVVSLPTGVARSGTAYLLDLRAQIAVEMALDHVQTAAVLERDPALRQFVLDALYYPSRMWKSGIDLDLGDGEAHRFTKYLEARIGRDGGAPDGGLERIPEELAGQLLHLARDVAEELADDARFVNDVEGWDDRRVRSGRASVGTSVREALRLDYPDTMIALLTRVGDHRYRWRFTTAGISRPAIESDRAEDAATDWVVDAALIDAFRHALAEVA